VEPAQFSIEEGSYEFRAPYADVIVGGACSKADRGGFATVGVQMTSALAPQSSFHTPRLSANVSLRWS
jgi:hypothetical protein